MEIWQVGSTKIAGRGRCLLESGEWSDCKFVVGGLANQETVAAHKLILAMASPVFAAMFFGKNAEDSDLITLPGIQPEGFKAMLRYIYCDELSLVSDEVAISLYPCAMKFQLTNVMTECLNYLGSNLWPERVLPVFDFAKRYGESYLLDQCVTAMCINTDQIITAESWKYVSKDAVCSLLALNFLVVVSELDLFDAILVWAKAQCQRLSLPLNRKSMKYIAGEPLKYIRFLTLSLHQFQVAPGKEELLEESEIEMISQRLSSVKKKTPLPEGFSEDRNDRAIPRAFVLDDSSPLKRRQLKYCFRTYKSLMHFNNEDHLRSSLTFSVDTPILLCGIKVSSQLPIIKGVPTPYSESLSAFLVYPNEQTCVLKQFVRDVSPDSVIPIEFNVVTPIEAFKTYRICVQFNKPGTYPAVDCCARDEECAGIKFSFNKGPHEHSIRSGLIRGLLFSKDVYPPATESKTEIMFERSGWNEKPTL